MKNNKVAIFWTATEPHHAFIFGELLEGRLRQGWGSTGMQLTENGKPVSLDLWSPRYISGAQAQWDVTPSLEDCKTRHSILSRMLHFERGDLVVVPKMPRTDEFCIARVTDAYTFDTSRFERVRDFGHVVHIDKESLKTYRHGSSSEARAVAAKFSHYRSAVNNINDTIYANKIRSLYDNNRETKS